MLALGLLLVEDGLFFFLDGSFLTHIQMRSLSWTYRIFHQCSGLGLGEPFHLQCPTLSHLALAVLLEVVLQLGLFAFAQPLASVFLVLAFPRFGVFVCLYHFPINLLNLIITYSLIRGKSRVVTDSVTGNQGIQGSSVKIQR